MKCPLKFARYEFEGGEECVGAECGFYGCVCTDESPLAESLYTARQRLSETQEQLWELAAERDELKKRVDEQQETLDNDCRDLIENDNEICKLTAERDELKAFSERLEMAAHDKLGVTLFGVDYVTEDFMLHVRDTLTAERDEWKAKYLGAVNDAEDYKTLWQRSRECSTKSAKRAAAVERLKANKPHTYMSLVRDAVKDYEGMCDADAFIDLLNDEDGLRSNDGVARSNDGVTNLEWLFENDYETLCDQMGGQPCSCCVVGCKEDLGSDEACSNALREWLTAPHEDAHSKAHSKTEQNLSEQSESLSDEADSREKLEAEILDAGCADEIDYDRIIGWLDRQAAITERECCKYIDGAGCDGPEVVHGLNKRIAELQAAYDELAAIAAQLCRACGFSMVDAAGEVIS